MIKLVNVFLTSKTKFYMLCGHMSYFLLTSKKAYYSTWIWILRVIPISTSPESLTLIAVPMATLSRRRATPSGNQSFWIQHVTRTVTGNVCFEARRRQRPPPIDAPQLPHPPRRPTQPELGSEHQDPLLG